MNFVGILNEIRYGAESIPLKAPLQYEYSKSTQKLHAEGLPSITGNGDTHDAALIDFSRKMFEFTEKYKGTRPPERSDDEEKLVRELYAIIDLNAYRDKTPVELTRSGEIRNAEGKNSLAIRWDNGTTSLVPINTIPPKLREPGTRIEATASYGSGNDQLKEIIKVVEEGPPPTPEEVKAFWANLEKARDQGRAGGSIGPAKPAR